MSIQFTNTEIKLIYLDTNALSNFIDNRNNFRINILNQFKNTDYEFCFNINNVMELKRGYTNRYNSFLEIFSIIPCILFKPYSDIIKEEVECANGKQFDISNISYSIVPGLSKEYTLEYLLNKFLPSPETTDEELNLLTNMNNQKNNYTDFVKLDKKYELEKIKDTLDHWNLTINSDINLSDFPAIRLINKSYYNRIVHGKKESIKKNDIHDIMISSVVPYVDIIVTESYQINVLKESKKFIQEIQNLQCYKVSDFYSY